MSFIPLPAPVTICQGSGIVLTVSPRCVSLQTTSPNRVVNFH